MIISRAWRARGAPVRPVTRVISAMYASAQDTLLFSRYRSPSGPPSSATKSVGSTGAEDFNNIDVNKHLKKKIRPWALGRKSWLFAGSLRRGKRAAAIMSLIQSARLNGHDPYAYLKDVPTRLPTQRASEITELLPHKWAPVQPPKVCGQVRTALILGLPEQRVGSSLM